MIDEIGRTCNLVDKTRKHIGSKTIMEGTTVIDGKIDTILKLILKKPVVKIKLD
jgi:hypothetical protein